MSIEATCWLPLLDSPLRSRAVRVIEHIADRISKRDKTKLSAVELCEGALLFGYLTEFQGYGFGCNLTSEFLDLANERIFANLPVALHGGLCEIGWIFQHLTGPVSDAEDPLKDLDSVLSSRLSLNNGIPSFDLISGLTGVGVYLLARCSSGHSRAALSTVVKELDKRAERMTEGLAWWTPADQLSDYERQLSPNGHYNLGVAHGIPAVIKFLADASAAGIEVQISNALFEGATRWLQQQQDPTLGSRYANWAKPFSQPSKVSRIAWCYGDLGIGALLLQAARALRRVDLEAFAIELIDSSLWRSPDRVDEGTLCHGAAGVAHIFGRAYQTLRLARYREAAQRYYSLTLSFVERDLLLDVLTDGFLDGAIGIALALTSAILPVEPCWDRLLMLS
jgi:hypothetical protein